MKKSIIGKIIGIIMGLTVAITIGSTIAVVNKSDSKNVVAINKRDKIGYDKNGNKT